MAGAEGEGEAGADEGALKEKPSTRPDRPSRSGVTLAGSRPARGSRPPSRFCVRPFRSSRPAWRRPRGSAMGKTEEWTNRDVVPWYGS